MTEYKQCCYSLCKAIKQARRQYRDKVESQFKGSNMRRMWQGLQSITHYKEKTSSVADIDVLLPDKFKQLLCSLLKQYRTTDTAQSVVPTYFKMATIILVPKKAKVSELNYYRPIALTSVIMKCFERLVKDHIKYTLPDTLDPLQFAYHPSRSTDDTIAMPLHTSHIWTRGIPL
jgi:hypothetical protein